MSISYKDAGVDVERGYKAVDLMKKHTRSTFNKNVLGDLGSFGGFFSIEDYKYSQPVLVSGTDGVGTKLKYAFILDKHDTIGIDAVAMCVNDIVCQGAKPLFFLDYIASGRIIPEKTAQIVGGMSEGCRQSDCALIGGETAEMPGFYNDGEYDIAGFTAGIVDKPKIINGAAIKENDVLIGIASSGIHSNGYSLVRKLFGEDRKILEKINPELKMPLGEALLTPTKIYVKTILELIKKHNVKGIAHITGGGFIENIPRIFPEGIGGKVEIKSYEVPAVFKLMQSIAGIDNQSIYNTFNMGVGMVLAVDKKDADSVLAALKGLNENAFIIGHTVKGTGLELC
ncbi:trifunctional purine biosynthetic protein adenosine-3-related [Holotrichia oblita]|nr:trifunctional purine biosynthetic protein adenosine-3-related [Holotrichia oblita]